MPRRQKSMPAGRTAGRRRRAVAARCREHGPSGRRCARRGGAWARTAAGGVAAATVPREVAAAGATLAEYRSRPDDEIRCGRSRCRAHPAGRGRSRLVGLAGEPPARGLSLNGFGGSVGLAGSAGGRRHSPPAARKRTCDEGPNRRRRRPCRTTTAIPRISHTHGGRLLVARAAAVLDERRRLNRLRRRRRRRLHAKPRDRRMSDFIVNQLSLGSPRGPK